MKPLTLVILLTGLAMSAPAMAGQIINTGSPDARNRAAIMNAVTPATRAGTDMRVCTEGVTPSIAMQRPNMQTRSNVMALAPGRLKDAGVAASLARS